MDSEPGSPGPVPKPPIVINPSYSIRHSNYKPPPVAPIANVAPNTHVAPVAPAPATTTTTSTATATSTAGTNTLGPIPIREPHLTLSATSSVPALATAPHPLLFVPGLNVSHMLNLQMGVTLSAALRGSVALPLPPALPFAALAPQPATQAFPLHPSTLPLPFDATEESTNIEKLENEVAVQVQV